MKKLEEIEKALHKSGDQSEDIPDGGKSPYNESKEIAKQREAERKLTDDVFQLAKRMIFISIGAIIGFALLTTILSASGVNICTAIVDNAYSIFGYLLTTVTGFIFGASLFKK